jgi:hypothetical protein
MESSAAPLASGGTIAARRRRLWTAIAKAALGLALLAALLFWGQIDVEALFQLVRDPAAVFGCLALLLVCLPLGALRWRVLLGPLGVSIPFVNLLHFFNIGVLANMFLFGSAGGDAVRGLYAWRATSRTGDRIAMSVLADRLSTMFALLFICLMFSVFNWRRMQQVPALAALAMSTVIAVMACIIAVGALFASPRLVSILEARFSRWPLVANLLNRGRALILTLRMNPLALLAAFVLALTTQILSVFGVLILAEAINIGTLRLNDLMLVVPLTLAVNALPLTPNGIGIGEAAFDQICHWLEPTPSSTPYSSIFLAFRLISVLACIPGLISLVIYRNPPSQGRIDDPLC